MEEAKDTRLLQPIFITSARHFVSLVSERKVILALNDKKMSNALLIRTPLNVGVNISNVRHSQMAFDNDNGRMQKPARFTDWLAQRKGQS